MARSEAGTRRTSNAVNAMLSAASNTERVCTDSGSRGSATPSVMNTTSRPESSCGHLKSGVPGLQIVERRERRRAVSTLGGEHSSTRIGEQEPVRTRRRLERAARQSHRPLPAALAVGGRSGHVEARIKHECDAPWRINRFTISVELCLGECAGQRQTNRQRDQQRQQLAENLQQ